MDWAVRDLTERQVYKLLVNTVLPRPIALVTTVDQDGVVNAAPFSFFNVMGSDPPVVALGLEGTQSRETGLKDTAQNICQSKEFVVNLVGESMVEAVNICAVDFPQGVTELLHAGLDCVPSRQVAAPRLSSSPLQMECRLHTWLELSASRCIAIGEVVHVHARDGVVDENLHVDIDQLGPVARLHGRDWYLRCTDRFQSLRRELAEWPAYRAGEK